MAKLNGKNADELAMKAVEILRPQTHWIQTQPSRNNSRTPS
jgi:hypothetical protein